MTTILAPTRIERDWIACDHCRTLLYRKRYVRGLRVCAHCGHHARLDTEERLAQLLEPGWQPVPVAATVHDPLSFTDQLPYPERLRQARERSGLPEAVRVVRGSLRGNPLVVAVMDFRFLGGSLGVAAGEAVTAAAEAALARRLPLLLVTASGGARMQEGVLSLMQMAKTSAALARLDDAGGLFISVLTDPTTGGVTASFAMLGDVILAEPKALIGFAGPRVIQQTIRQELPEGFQRSEYLLRTGMVDRVVRRRDLRSEIARIIDYAGK